jgi:hypothetical protein
MNKLYTDYAVLEAQIAELTAQKDAKKEQIIADMIERGEKNEETDLGKFTLATLKNWTYSDNFYKKEEKVKESIKELTEDIKAMKAKEEEDEIATYVEKPSLRFTPIKL